MGASTSRPQDPTRKIEVIDAGFSRTATSSFSLALERLLNGHVMHGGSQLFSREDAYTRKLATLYRLRREIRESPTTTSSGRRRRRQVEELLKKTLTDCTKGFSGCADAPFIHFLPELLELYPEAKVVLVTRDRERWWKSFGGPFGEHSDQSSLWLLKFLVMPLPGVRWFGEIAEGFQEDRKNTLGVPVPNKNLIDIHNDWVRRTVPAERLLEMDLAAGWEPLCKFLGKPVPPAEQPFPRVNDAEFRDQVIRNIFFKACAAWVAVLGSGVGVGWVAWWATSKSSWSAAAVAGVGWTVLVAWRPW